MVKILTHKTVNFDKLSTHPLQTWGWGDFRQSSRVDTVRFGEYSKGKLINTYQVTFHRLPIPALPFTFGYCPKSKIPSTFVLQAIEKEAKSRKALMVKFEPNILKKDGLKKISKLRHQFRFTPGRPLFTKFTFWLDLTKTEAELLSQMKSKTRYNLRLAEKKEVIVSEDPLAFKDYLALTKETTLRQGFYAHSPQYHQQMWQTLQHVPDFVHLFKAVYKGETLVTWILFILNGILYYPYGASSEKYKEVMASNLMMWEVIKFGKANNCRLFDLWGSTGPNPKKNDPWLGFHRFKEGYGANLVEFVGTYDLIINPLLYYPYRLGESLRWFILRLIK